MSRFNESTKGSTKTLTYEGGQAYLKPVESDWTNMLFSYLFGRNQPSFYGSSTEKEERFIKLTKDMIDLYDAPTVAKFACFSRNILGMRSISSMTAAILNDYQFESKRQFYKNFFHRPDDVAEVFSAIEASGSKRSHALVRGAGDYLSNLSEYSLSKYKMLKHEYNIYDLINITHSNSYAIDKLKTGEIKSPDTWEVRISTAESAKDRDSEWIRLVEENKLGYLALIRNLRNILNIKSLTKDWVKTYLVPQIVNAEAIKKSLVFPYQIYVAYKSLDDECSMEVKMALSDAIELATSNIPKLAGKTLIIQDVSGSMSECFNGNNMDLTISEVCSVYSSALYLSDNDIDVIKFGTFKADFEFPKTGNFFELVDSLSANQGLGYSTEIVPVFEYICDNEREYDRIIIFSDMQVMDGITKGAYRKYASRLNNDCKVYSFDLGHYPSQLLPADDIHYVTALTDKVFDFINIAESGKSIMELVNKYRFF